jgi:16S rRNA (cytidine1402-2'-O)-methyltransferase
MTAKLYIIATPIGNMEDVTLRAIRILGEVDTILCEDTRETKKLLQRYEINKPTLSYHAQSKLSKVEKIFELLQAGRDLALVSDAGTPTISDPGCMLVDQVRAEFGADVEIIPIPGASAVLSALSVSGFPTSEFVFLGFLPHKKGRETLFREITSSKRTVVFYESPHRMEKTLASLKFPVRLPKSTKRMCVALFLRWWRIFRQMEIKFAVSLWLLWKESNPCL